MPLVNAPNMVVQEVDCRNLTVQFLDHDHFKALEAKSWSLSPGGFINFVEHLQGSTYAVNTSRRLAGVLYTITANV